MISVLMIRALMICMLTIYPAMRCGVIDPCTDQMPEHVAGHAMPCHVIIRALMIRALMI